jgi:hypothetical protein
VWIIIRPAVSIRDPSIKKKFGVFGGAAHLYESSGTSYPQATMPKLGGHKND